MPRRRRPPVKYHDPDGISDESMAAWRRQVREYLKFEREEFRKAAALARKRGAIWQEQYRHEMEFRWLTQCNGNGRGYIVIAP